MRSTNVRYFQYIELLLLLTYKIVLEFYFMPRYFKAYGYMFFFEGSVYIFSFEKYIISIVLFGIMLCFTLKIKSNEFETYSFLIRILLLIVIIPTLSVYAFISSINLFDMVIPFIFYLLLFVLIKKDSFKDIHTVEYIKIPKIRNVDIILLIVCGGISVIIWLLMGRPMVTTFDAAVEQRIALRADAMPRIMGYMHTFLGGVVFPYLFAKFIENKKYALAFLGLVFGYMMFSINGMKTWILLYVLFLLIAFVRKIDKECIQLRCMYIELACIGILLICGIMYNYFHIPTFLAQFGRMIIVPPTIGYRSSAFFSENELLYLRESIMRNLFVSPYPNGSDYFIFYGLDSTISSGRANCGLWGDAYKNFGILGVIIYPFLYEKVYHLVIENGRKLSETMRSFILLIVIWSTINLSFFTSLLTGGIIVLIVLEKMEKWKNVRFPDINQKKFNEGMLYYEKQDMLYYNSSSSKRYKNFSKRMCVRK